MIELGAGYEADCDDEGPVGVPAEAFVAVNEVLGELELPAAPVGEVARPEEVDIGTPPLVAATDVDNGTGAGIVQTPGPTDTQLTWTDVPTEAVELGGELAGAEPAVFDPAGTDPVGADPAGKED